MSVNTISASRNLFRLGRGILLLSAALMTLMHFSLIFVLKEPVLFLGFAVFNLYAFLVLLFPFRQGEKWAWIATWLLPIGLALPATLDPDIAFYYGIAAVCVVGLLLTMKNFFKRI